MGVRKLKIKILILIIVCILIGLICYYRYPVNTDDKSTVSNYDNGNIEVNDNVAKFNIEDNISIKKSVSPSGFPGATMHRLNLYANGNVHLTIYDGEGYGDENIKFDEIIAKNVADVIQDEESESIFITGSNIDIVNSKYKWITFKKE